MADVAYIHATTFYLYKYFAFLAIWLVDTARLSNGSYWLPSNYNIFFKMAAYRIAIMNDDIRKFGHDVTKKKKDKIHEKCLTKNL
jgi:hypothetical protein